MIVSRRQHRKDSPIDVYIKNFIAMYIDSIDENDLTYLDEVYMILANRIAEMQKIGAVSFDFIDSTQFTRSSDFSEFFGDVRQMSDFAFQSIPGLYEDLNRVAGDVAHTTEDLATRISSCEALIDVAHAMLKRKSNISSIKDELLMYDTFGSSSYMSEGSLYIDRRAGSMTLPILSKEEVDYSVVDTRCNYPKAIMRNPAMGEKTWANVTNGYFTSRTFAEAPLFENERTENPDRIKDGDLETAYLVEYNTHTEGVPISLALDLDFDSSRIDALEFSVEPSDDQSTLARVQSLPELSSIFMKDVNDEGVDKTDEAIDNTIRVKTATLGKRESKIVHRKPDKFPVAHYLLSEKSVEDGIQSLTVELSMSNPQSIYYPEKIIRTSDGRTLYRFNYYETLVLNNYDPPDGFFDPKDWYTIRERGELYGKLNSGMPIADDLVRLYRYFIGIKELRLLRYTYDSAGEIISSNLNEVERELAGVDLYVNEVVPDGCLIYYYISVDRKEWHQISPLTRSEHGAIPTRLVFGSDLDTEEGDKLVEVRAEKLYLKIKMIGSQGRSPILKSYAVRMKYL